jgi:hypothetical protein
VKPDLQFDACCGYVPKAFLSGRKIERDGLFRKAGQTSIGHSTNIFGVSRGWGSNDYAFAAFEEFLN